MKKNMTRKLLGMALTGALALTTLTACGGAPAPTESAATSNPQPTSQSAVQETAGAVAGTVLLSVNPEIEMDYDQAGNVVALNALNEDGRAVLSAYSGYEGRACTEVIGELVDEINAAGYFDATIAGQARNIVLKLERGSAYPSDQFLNELAEAVRLVVESGQIGSQAVALDRDDYDEAYGDLGYINAAAAQSILAAQLGRDDIQFAEQEYDLGDGEYEVEFVLDGISYEYEVNAVTGKVSEMDAEFQDYDDTDYGPDSDGATDYGVTDYDDTDYGPNNDGVTDYAPTPAPATPTPAPVQPTLPPVVDTDYGYGSDGVTDYTPPTQPQAPAGDSGYDGGSNYGGSSNYGGDSGYGDSGYDD